LKPLWPRAYLNRLKLDRYCMRTLFALILVAPLAIADDLKSVHGLWGTEAQCSRSLITPKGTKHAAPFDVRPNWLVHGEVWCRLNWASIQSTENGTIANAHAICGEDMERDYQIRFVLTGDTLTVVWNLEFQNGPMKRCS